MPRNPNNPRRVFSSDEERKQAEYERKKRWREANREKHKASIDSFYARNPRYRKDKHLRDKYGLSSEDITMILELQHGGCAICRSIDPGRNGRSGKRSEWIVDHDHETGQVRGIICHPCNVALGMVKDSKKVLKAMLAYLEEAEKNKCK